MYDDRVGNRHGRRGGVRPSRSDVPDPAPVPAREGYNDEGGGGGGGGWLFGWWGVGGETNPRPVIVLHEHARGSVCGGGGFAYASFAPNCPFEVINLSSVVRLIWSTASSAGLATPADLVNPRTTSCERR